MTKSTIEYYITCKLPSLYFGFGFSFGLDSNHSIFMVHSFLGVFCLFVLRFKLYSLKISPDSNGNGIMCVT